MATGVEDIVISCFSVIVVVTIIIDDVVTVKRDISMIESKIIVVHTFDKMLCVNSFIISMQSFKVCWVRRRCGYNVHVIVVDI